MMQEKYSGAIISFVTALLLFMLQKLQAFKDIESNIIFIIFLFIVLTGIGSLIGHYLGDGDEVNKHG